MTTTNASSSDPIPPRRFGTILVARPQSRRPAELEVLLREHCNKMRILSSPAKLSGAHMVFEKGIALRIYYPQDIALLDHRDGDSDGGTDGIFDFCMSFQWPMVFFVLPDNHHGSRGAAVSDFYHDGSFIDRAITMSYLENVAADKSPPRLMVVANTAQVLAAFFAFADDVTSSERREKRAQIVQSIQSSVHDPACVASAMRNLVAPPRCLMGEAEIVLRSLGNLHAIVRHCGTPAIIGEDNLLDQLPIDRRTKDILKAFFMENLGNRDWLPGSSSGGSSVAAETYHDAPLLHVRYEMAQQVPRHLNQQFGHGARAPPQPSHTSFRHLSLQGPSFQNHTNNTGSSNIMPRGGMSIRAVTHAASLGRPVPQQECASLMPAPQGNYSLQYYQQLHLRTGASFSDPRIQASRHRPPNRPAVGRPTYQCP